MTQISSNKVKLNKTVFQNAEPRNNEYTLWDTDTKGLGLRIRPTGKKTFIWKRRCADGKTPKMTLKADTVHFAKKEAEKLNAIVSNGDNPAVIKNERLQKIEREEKRTVKAYWENYYWPNRAVLRNKPSTQKQSKRRWNNVIEPKIGHMPIEQVTKQDIDNCLSTILKNDKDGNLFGYSEYNNVLRLLRVFFNDAIKDDWITINPCRNTQTYKVERRQLKIDMDFVGELFKKIDELSQTGKVKKQIAVAIKLTAILGTRLNEIGELLKWDQIDFKKKEIRWEDSKNGPQKRLLNDETIKILKTVEPVEGNPWVLHSIRDKTKPLSGGVIYRNFKRIVTLMGYPDQYPHQLRHLFASETARTEGLSLRDGMELTGHKSFQAYMFYQHGNENVQRVASESYTQKILAASQTSDKETTLCG